MDALKHRSRDHRLRQPDRVVFDLDPAPGADFSAVRRAARQTGLRERHQARARPFPPAYLAWFDWKVAKSFVGRSDLGRRIMEVSAEQEDASGGDPKRDPGAQRP